MTARDLSKLAGEMIGQFRVGQPLPGTRSGLLYTGWDYAAGGERKRVWLQFFDERQAGDAEALRRQVEAWQGFQHKTVLPIVGFECGADAPPLIAFEPGDGDILSQRLDAGRLDLVDAIQLVLTIARAVAKAHAANVVHLGISEEHVVVPKFTSAAPALLGLGVAGRFAHGGLVQWHYLAPEQIVDEFGGDARADVYALGVLLYRCTTGQFPVSLADGLSADETASELTIGVRRDPRQWFDPPHAGLIDVIERATHKKRERRFQTAAEFVTALQECGLPLVSEIPVEKSDPKGVVLTPPPARVPEHRAGAHAPTISPTPAPSREPAAGGAQGGADPDRPKTLTIEASSAATDLRGMVLKDVRIEEQIGEGGMAKVYLGKHVEVGRSWIVKVGEVGSALAQWSKQEANVTALLRQHGEKRVPEVMGFNYLPDGRPYMIMEFIEGRTLAKVLADAPLKRLPLIRVLKIIYRLADTLERAHGLGIVHRDIKPENIMVERVHGEEDADIRVLDWGIAKAPGDAKLVVTQTGMLIGTPGYLSPEGISGEKVDGRTDVFSVACLMYEMLAGKPPFPGDDYLERSTATLGFHPEPLASLRPDLGKYAQDVSDLVTLGLTKHKQHRPTMEMFRAALKEIMDNIEERRAPNAPSPLRTMLSAAPIRTNLPLAERSTHAPTDADHEEARPRFVAPDVTRPARRNATPKSNRVALRVAVVALVVLVVGSVTYALISRRATSSDSAPTVAQPVVAPPSQPETPKPTPTVEPKPVAVPPAAVEQPRPVNEPVTNKQPATRPADAKRTKRHAHGAKKNSESIIDPFEE